MAIDTRNRRASCIGLDGPFRSVYPNPDGAISSGADRQQVAYKYPGIAAGGAPPAAPGDSPFVNVYRRRRR